MLEFNPGEKKTAIISMRNTSAAPFDYEAILYMGVNMAATASASFHLNEGETKNIEFQITMPSLPGAYTVYLDISVGGVPLAHYQSTENITITESVLPERLGSFTLFVTNVESDAVQWNVNWSGGGYLYEYHPISSSFLIFDIDLNDCRFTAIQRRENGAITRWDRYGSFSKIKDGNTYTLDLITGELFGDFWDVPPEPPPVVTTSLGGRVTSWRWGNPIAGAVGIVYQDKGSKTWSYEFVTDANGYYFIDNMRDDADVTMMAVYADHYDTYDNPNIPISTGENTLNIEML